MKDAEFCPIRILRPYDGFQTVYEAQPADTPLLFSEAGEALDPFAASGTPYSPALVKGQNVPLGARVILWVPMFRWIDSRTDPQLYRWTFIWRLRSMFDFGRGHDKPYHFPWDHGESVAGLAVIPTACQTVTYMQTEPAVDIDRAVQNVRSEDLRFGSSNLPDPLLPAGTGIVQQGVPTTSILPTRVAMPLYQVHEMQAMGDELVIGLYRATDDTANWAFGVGAADNDVPTKLANRPQVGVYMTYGAAP